MLLSDPAGEIPLVCTISGAGLVIEYAEPPFGVVAVVLGVSSCTPEACW